MRLMQRIRDSILNDCFPEFAKKFIRNYYLNQAENVSKLLDKDNRNSEQSSSNNEPKIPEWVVNALKEVNIDILEEN